MPNDLTDRHQRTNERETPTAKLGRKWRFGAAFGVGLPYKGYVWWSLSSAMR